MDAARAKRLLEQGDLVGAEAAYRQLEADPSQRAEARYGLGLVQYQRRDLDAADQCFRASLQINPHGENALYYRGEIAAMRGKRKEAVRFYAQVLAQNPNHAGALARLGNPDAMAPPASPAPMRQSQSTPGPGAAQQSSTSAHPPHAPSSSHSTVGIAQRVKLQVVPFNGQAAAKQLLTFRVAVMRRDGRQRETVGIEMRSFHIRGQVDDGDWVEIEHIGRGGRVKSFRNLTTGSHVRSRMW